MISTWIAQHFLLISEDEFHRETDMCSWELFPPSFYRTHTEEEIKEATERTRERVMKLLEELEEMEGK